MLAGGESVKPIRGCVVANQEVEEILEDLSEEQKRLLEEVNAKDPFAAAAFDPEPSTRANPQSLTLEGQIYDYDKERKKMKWLTLGASALILPGSLVHLNDDMNGDNIRMKLISTFTSAIGASLLGVSAYLFYEDYKISLEPRLQDAGANVRVDF